MKNMYPQKQKETTHTKMKCSHCKESYCETDEEIKNRMCQPCDEVNFNQHDRDTLQNMKNPVCM